MRKLHKNEIIGISIIAIMIALIVFKSSFLTIVNLSGNSVTFNNVTYKCDDDQSPLSSDLQMAGCRLCAMNQLASTYDAGITKYGLGDCIAKMTSKGRTKYVFDGPNFDKSGYDFNTVAGQEAYVGAVESRFVTWSLQYNYCPTQGLIYEDEVGACTPVTVTLPAVNNSQTNTTAQTSPSIHNNTTGIIIIASILAIFIATLIYMYRKKK